MARSLKLKTQPAAEIVSVREALDHLRIDTDDERILIDSYIKGARARLEAFTGRSFIDTTWEFTLDATDITSLIELPRAPLSSITSITTTNDANVTTTVTASDYYAITTSEPGRVSLVSGNTWPTDLRAFSSFTVEYVSGYGALVQELPDSVRFIVKQAVLLTVARWYEHRSDTKTTVGTRGVPEIPLEAKGIAEPLKVHYL